MSENWVKDIEEMHDHYGIRDKVSEMSPETLRKMLDFRFTFLTEEITELGDAIEAKDPADVVDALIDLCVVAIGTLDLFGVDSEVAWNRVLEANMNKQVGVKSSRPNPLGLPDLIKPTGWESPVHDDNVGTLFSWEKKEEEDDDIISDDDYESADRESF